MLAVKAIVLLPLLAAICTGLLVRVMPPLLAQLVTSGSVIVSAVLAAIVFQDVVFEGITYNVHLLAWMQIGELSVNWAFRVDPLTAVMLIVVTWVSAVVHLYSIGYMSHDAHRQRFMAYLSLFTFFMLLLVTADNFLQLFVGWEGVGLASYLLIGFWFKRESANEAAMKAFIVNRVGDFGLVLAMVAIYLLYGSLDFDAVFAAAQADVTRTISAFSYEFHALTLICILLFIGAMGKSAQLGLHTWLPDAMEGPTPVSALIHAATMVTAGVFLVARCSPLFEHSPDALLLVTIVGALTALFAATIGMVQNDIKKVIAYSTCSQLGYMFFACGVGAYAAAIFHLMTHAFFKALLFLGAGSVIHGMGDEQDMRKMGGIWKKMPVTYAFMWLGSLALAGVPFFAGFYSKDLVLESAFAVGTEAGKFAFWMGIVAAFLTAFYSWRLIIMTFHGKTRAPQSTFDHAHEASLIMNLPLLLLAVGAVTAGWLGYHWLYMVGADGAFWRGAIYTGPGNNVLEAARQVEPWVKWLPVGVGACGILIAALLYGMATNMPAKIASAFKPIYALFLNRWFVDEIYNFLFVRGAQRLGLKLWKWMDVRLIDGLGPNGMASLCRIAAGRVSAIQTGYLHHYAFVMLLGVVALLTWYFLTRTAM